MTALESEQIRRKLIYSLNFQQRLNAVNNPWCDKMADGWFLLMTMLSYM